MNKLKRTTEEVSDYFDKQGCQLLGEYLGALSKMKYRCHCGVESETTWNRFSRGSRCGHCAKHGQKKKRSIEDVHSIFKQRECEFLDKEFIGIHHKHSYRCKCGTIAEITFAAFHFQSQDCKSCGLEKLKGSKHPQWNPNREEIRLKMLVRKKCYKALDSSLQATGKIKVGRTSDMIGYGPKELQAHIVNHPNWAAVKDGDWALDHIFPIAAFVEHGITDLKIINSLDNLQPLSRELNESKGAEYDKDDFLVFVAKKMH